MISGIPMSTDEDLFRPRMTTRRQILTGAASVAMTGWASAEPRPHRLAYLVPASPAANALNQRALFGALAELGYREGHNLMVERRFAEGRLDRLSALAAELVALKPDVFFAAGSQATLAASKATTTVPIVFVAVSDPVGMRIVKALRRPGTNATGLSNQADEFSIKILQLLKEVFPSASRVALLHDPTNLPLVGILPTLKQAARGTRPEPEGDRGEITGGSGPRFQAAEVRAPRRALCSLRRVLRLPTRTYRGIGERPASGRGVRAQ